MGKELRRSIETPAEIDENVQKTSKVFPNYQFSYSFLSLLPVFEIFSKLSFHIIYYDLYKVNSKQIFNTLSNLIKESIFKKSEWI